MDNDTARRWNQRYARDSGGLPPVDSAAEEPAWVLKRYAHLLPAQGRALDLACGLGANALFLAQQGLASHAWDIAENAIERLAETSSSLGLNLSLQTRDVVASPPEAGSFDVIVVSRFLDRSLFPALAKALAPSGVLFYQTFVVGNKTGPSNPDYLLRQGELLELLDGLTVRAYEEAGRCGQLELGLRDEACIVVQTLTGDLY